MDQSKKIRNFHNEVKFRILTKYVDKSESIRSLLDIGTGRGGDIHKWYKLKIQYVTAIDINKKYINEAIKRYNSTNYLKLTNYRFYYTTEEKMFKLYLNSINHKIKHDIITCMFALHYFCKNMKTLESILLQVSESLPNNGYFVCVSPLGERIMEILRGEMIYKTNTLMVERCFDELKKIGDKVKFMMSGTLYFGEKIISEEYLIFEETLRNVGEKFNLKLIEYSSFKNEYSNINGLSDESKEVSFLNGVIVFQKMDANPELLHKDE
tara:strand:+ start:2200 stop:3000 length:801 start_codon:yes stop_codon:yes gene_type:complete